MKVSVVEYYFAMTGVFALGLLGSWGLFYRDGLIEKYCSNETAADWAAAIGTFAAVLVAIIESSRRSREERTARRQRAAMFSLAFDRELFNAGVFMARVGALARSALASDSIAERKHALLGIVMGHKQLRFPLLTRFADSLTDFDRETSARLVLALGQLLTISERASPEEAEIMSEHFTTDKRTLTAIESEAVNTVQVLTEARESLRQYIKDVARIKVDLSIEDALKRAFPDQ